MSSTGPANLGPRQICGLLIDFLFKTGCRQSPRVESVVLLDCLVEVSLDLCGHICTAERQRQAMNPTDSNISDFD